MTKYGHDSAPGEFARHDRDPGDRRENTDLMRQAVGVIREGELVNQGDAH